MKTAGPREGGEKGKPHLSLILPLLLTAVWLAVAGNAIAKGALKVAAPADRVWVTEKKLFVAGAVEGGAATHVAVKGVKVAAKKGRIPVVGGGFGAMITLKKGLNEIKLSAGDAAQTLRVYYTPSGKKPPQGFKRFHMHSDPLPLNNCKECHKQRKGMYNFKRVIPAKAKCIECHTDMAKAAHVHGPVGAGVCISCHTPHGSIEPLHLARGGRELCMACHQAKQKEFSQKVVHAPVEEGCTDCHDPHQSPMRFQLRAKGDTVSALCFKCHEKAIFTKSVQHGPVMEGDCIACHSPHASENAALLIAPAADGEVCFTCHEDRKEDFTMKHIHAPAEEDCNQCHDPHSSEAEFQLHEPAGKLCASCHEDMHPGVYEAKNTATHKHPPVDQGRCTDCHRPHSSNYHPLLKDAMEKLCLSCHAELGDEVAAGKYRHGPVKTGDCTACHMAHGSKNNKMLVRYFPKEFYSEYRPEKYDLCFGCHNKDIAKKKLTTTLTGFRDGDYNLHYFHVNMKKGRSCIACHDAHVSNQPKHVRYEVPYGAWSYPISLTKTAVGGTCVVGCHAPKTYDRKNPKIKRRSR